MNTIDIDGRATLYHDDCRNVLRSLDDNSIDSVVTDPPYALVSIQKRFGNPGSKPASDVYGRGAAGFMGKQWDTGETAFSEEFWGEVLRVLKPGGHVVAFSGTRTYHRMAVAIEDAGFEIRDQLAWTYATGFPKSHDVAKGIDKRSGFAAPEAGALVSSNGSMTAGNYERTDKGDAITDEAKRWQGWGTALKPAWEPICLARKPLTGTVAANVLKHGVGAINVDGCRVGDEVRYAAFTSLSPCHGNAIGAAGTAEARRGTQGDAKKYVGRWPANIIHNGSDEVISAFPGEASRFFYCAKASARDRDEGLDEIAKRPGAGVGALRDGSRTQSVRANTHPTVKPTPVMQWLCRLITPPGGLVLDPFMGSGSTGKAALLEGFKFIGCEREDEYLPIAEARIRFVTRIAANDNNQLNLFGRSHAA